MRTRVFITIDTEFSIGGAFSAPDRLQPIGTQNVDCCIDGRSWGLGWMLDTFAAHGVRATFFVEALQTAYFGDEPMRSIAHRVRAAGHDVQLHLHPVWTYFDDADWQQRLASVKPSDNMHRRTVGQLASWMRRGIDAFERWGIARPVALRTGNLMVDANVYLAMREVGLGVASNVGRAVFEPAEELLHLNAGIHRVHGITELPILTYQDLGFGAYRHCKSLTITGTSFGEARALLDEAHRQALSSVVLLTHCHEFIKGDMRSPSSPNRLNQRRLDSLCRYLHDNSDRFEVAVMADMAAPSIADDGPANPMIRVPPWLTAMRIAQNRLSDSNLVA